jgi:uncharacterized protein involved in exopolysaccharide biosynthesis
LKDTKQKLGEVRTVEKKQRTNIVSLHEEIKELQKEHKKELSTLKQKTENELKSIKKKVQEEDKKKFEQEHKNIT